MTKYINFSIHPEGFGFAALAILISLGLALLHPILGGVGGLISIWVLYFFRDPLRVPPKRPSIVSAGDGIVVAVQENATLPGEIESEEKLWTRVSVFLNIFDVHINRIPVTGHVKKVYYHKGQFLNASFDKASELNERNSLVIQTEAGHQIVCTQIAGFIARRIRCDVKPGDFVTCGQKYGLIRFGSRMDVYLPEGVVPRVEKGQRMIAGETVLAEYP